MTPSAVATAAAPPSASASACSSPSSSSSPLSSPPSAPSPRSAFSFPEDDRQQCQAEKQTAVEPHARCPFGSAGRRGGFDGAAEDGACQGGDGGRWLHAGDDQLGAREWAAAAAAAAATAERPALKSPQSPPGWLVWAPEAQQPPAATPAPEAPAPPPATAAAEPADLPLYPPGRHTAASSACPSDATSRAACLPTVGGASPSGLPVGSASSAWSSASASHDRDQDSLKPLFHVMPVSGWGSDPNGPIFYKGRYHLFYQAVAGTCQWHWGVGWEHVVSTDLAHWERLPPAIFPTPGGPDADGCFSGSIAVDPHSGVPVCFYTGARLRTNADVPLPHPPPSHDMGLPHFESQCCAVCDPDDELLAKWRKVPMPLMELPHTGQLEAWRDPWFVEQGDGRGKEWTMLIGSGLKGQGGTVLVYRTQDLTRGWRFISDMCSWPDTRMGVVWECPFLVQLQPLPLCAHVLPTTDLAADPAAAPQPPPPLAAAAAAADPAAAAPPAAPEASTTLEALPGKAAAGGGEAESGAGSDAASGSSSGQESTTDVLYSGSRSSRSSSSGGGGGGADGYGTAELGNKDDSLVCVDGVPFEGADGRQKQQLAAAVAAAPSWASSLAPPLPEQSAALPPTDAVTAAAAAAKPPDSQTDSVAKLVDELMVAVVSEQGHRGDNGVAGGTEDDAFTSVGPAAAASILPGADVIDVSVTAAAPPPPPPPADVLGSQGPAGAVTTITVRHAASVLVASVLDGTDGGSAAAAAAADGGGRAMDSTAAATDAVAPPRVARQPPPPSPTPPSPTPPPLTPVPSQLPSPSPPRPDAAAAVTGVRRRRPSLVSSALTASATVPADAAGDRAVLQDLHSMVKQVMEAHQARARAEADAAAVKADRGGGGATAAAATRDSDGGGCKLRYCPGVMGHSAVPEPNTEIEQLPVPVTMRYHKAQPLLPPPPPPTESAMAAPTSIDSVLKDAATDASDGTGVAAGAASGGGGGGGGGGAGHMPRHADVDSTSGHAYASRVPPRRRWLFGNAPDGCHISGDLVGTRPIFWMGEYDSRAAKYDIANAIGAAPLDIGNCLYAPACFQDLQGRHILWGYMKELRRVPPAPALCDKYSYAGCVSLPRALYIRGDKLFQLPLPELTALRSDVAVHVSQVALTHGSPWRLSGVRGLHLDVELAVSPGTAQRTVVLFHSWRPHGRGAAALVYDWTSRRLYVVFEAMHPRRQALWRGCGPLRQPQKPLQVNKAPRIAPMQVPPPHDPGSQLQQQQQPQRHLPAANRMHGHSPSRSHRHADEGQPHAQEEDGRADGGFATAADAMTHGSAHAMTHGSIDPATPPYPLSDEELDEGGIEEPQPHQHHRHHQQQQQQQGHGQQGQQGQEQASERRQAESPPPPRTTRFQRGLEDWLWMRRGQAGGELDLPPGSPLRLRLFLDASCLEVFTGSGQVLTTRVYRGHPPLHPHPHPHAAAATAVDSGGPDPGIEILAVGGSCSLDDLHAYEVHSAWVREGDAPLDGFVRK
ncbi:Putative beta-Fructufuranosidase [Pleodorina starrii]|uniref:Beta-Fructufuranosidase n=1 Tax=Pleodorina starrii TaxID=330485 RepID=A0A9W6F3K7_9CHLO|nr:Putative beta-Fructufuranosidase [Pleodorina starrii]GLC54959.1 Putative beta-Fructufuranosidase [Pleodorina starrii]GLC68478.1 Putative beta-Fructufuranosidase [Pleodorina starrii]